MAGQLWIGGTQQNNVSKGLFKRNTGLQGARRGALPVRRLHAVPEAAGTAAPAPPGSRSELGAGASRNKYKASFHDITRFGIFKLDGDERSVVGKIDVDEANNATDIEFSADGTVAYVVDLMFNSYHVFNTARGRAAT